MMASAAIKYLPAPLQGTGTTLSVVKHPGELCSQHWLNLNWQKKPDQLHLSGQELEEKEMEFCMKLSHKQCLAQGAAPRNAVSHRNGPWEAQLCADGAPHVSSEKPFAEQVWICSAIPQGAEGAGLSCCCNTQGESCEGETCRDKFRLQIPAAYGSACTSSDAHFWSSKKSNSSQRVLSTLNLHLPMLTLASVPRLGRACSTSPSSYTVGTSWQEAAQCQCLSLRSQNARWESKMYWHWKFHPPVPHHNCMGILSQVCAVSSALVNTGRVKFRAAELQIMLSSTNGRSFKLFLSGTAFIYNTEGIPRAVSSASRQPRHFT